MEIVKIEVVKVEIVKVEIGKRKRIGVENMPLLNKLAYHFYRV